MKTKFTPGPWKHEANEIIGGIGTNRAAVVCKLASGHVSPAPVFSYLDNDTQKELPTVDANARLIASAPELFAALETLLESVHKLWPADCDCIKGYVEARAALAKSTGKNCSGQNGVRTRADDSENLC
jgi:hypothetical protein